MTEVEREVIIVNRLGLHARAAGHFRRTAALFKSEIKVVKDSMTVNAKSLLGIMALEASQGTSIRILARGPDAGEAVEALARIVADRFGEGE